MRYEDLVEGVEDRQDRHWWEYELAAKLIGMSLDVVLESIPWLQMMAEGYVWQYLLDRGDDRVWAAAYRWAILRHFKIREGQTMYFWRADLVTGAVMDHSRR